MRILIAFAAVASGFTTSTQSTLVPRFASNTGFPQLYGLYGQSFGPYGQGFASLYGGIAPSLYGGFAPSVLYGQTYSSVLYGQSFGPSVLYGQGSVTYGQGFAPSVFYGQGGFGPLQGFATLGQGFATLGQGFATLGQGFPTVTSGQGFAPSVISGQGFAPSVISGQGFAPSVISGQGFAPSVISGQGFAVPSAFYGPAVANPSWTPAVQSPGFVAPFSGVGFGPFGPVFPPVVLPITGPVVPPVPTTAPRTLKTIVENALATPALSTLVQVLTSPGYEPILQLLSGPGNFTVFAPNNAAFAAAGVDPAQTKLVTAVLQYHVLGTHIDSDQLPPLAFANTLLTNPEFVNIGQGKGQFIGVSKDRSGNVEIYFGAPQRDKARVVVADVESSNGVVHIIDRVLFFPNLTSVKAGEAGLQTLLEAVVKANLVSAVDTTPGITIFAPTNRAFEAVGGIANLTPTDLASILSYHVVPAQAFSTDLSNGQKLPTLQGGNLTVQIDGGKVFISGAEVVQPNIITKNAVIHIIDRVLLPQ